MALIDKLTALGDAIRSKTGKTEKLTLDQMATEIAGIQTGGGELPEEAFLITGDCQYRFRYGAWDWYLDTLAKNATTKDITNCSYMFERSNVKNIPFEINCTVGQEVSMQYMFASSKIEMPPKINYILVKQTDHLFSGCTQLKAIPDDWCVGFDWQNQEAATSPYVYSNSAMFSNCLRIRKIPKILFSKSNPVANGTYFDSGFYKCYSLDELADLPIPYTSERTTNCFNKFVQGCMRLKTLTFERPNGQPLVKSWKNQTIDISQNVGTTGGSYGAEQNAGWTTDTQVEDDTTYQALKNTEDWWTKSYDYSRYNHDSAVATINSLPDTSAYLAANGGTNTIKFKGISGSKTDGGAINTLTEAEIAVATAKGWTVTLV